MTISRLSIHGPQGTMGLFASWRHINGYWRWALYFDKTHKGLSLSRARSASWISPTTGEKMGGGIFPHFGGELVTPLGAIYLATQPPWRVKSKKA